MEQSVELSATTIPPSGEVVNPALKYIEFKQLLDKEGGIAAFTKVMERTGYSEDQIRKVIESGRELGFNLNHIEKFVLQVMFTQFVVNDQIDTVSDTFKIQIGKELAPILSRSASIHQSIVKNMTEIEKLLSELNASGTVAEQFKIALLDKMAAGIEQQVLTIHGTLSDILARQQANIDSVNEHLSAAVETMNGRLNAATKRVNQAADFSEKRFDALIKVAEQRQQASISRSEAKLDALLKNVKEGIEEKYWIERIKLWAGVLILTGISNYLLMHYFFWKLM